jgi:peptidoglycan/LPS O-acetylase OafA/YrhL
MATEGSVRARASPRHVGPAAGRVPPLDGIRGVALVTVLLYHSFPGTFRGGFLGVEMFFVLSGFLLTTLLLDEHRKTQTIDVRAYAGRRIRRIVPALVVVLTGLAVVGLFLPQEDAHRLGRDIIASLAGLTNWHLIREGTSYFGGTGRPPLVRHLWSIAVELQAYVVLPFVAFAIAKRSRAIAIRVLAGGIAGSALLMAIISRTSGTTRAYYGTDTRIGALLTGALVAVVLAQRTKSSQLRISQRSVVALTVLAGATLVALVLVIDDRSGFLYPAGFLIAQASAAALITSATRWDTSRNVLSEPALRWLGTRSYGIYLWHWPIVALVRPGVDVAWNPVLVGAAGIGLAVMLGDLSYRFVERPFLTGRFTSWPRIRIRIAGASWAVAMFVLIALLAQAAPVDPIAESIAAGERALEQQNNELPEGYGDDPPVQQEQIESAPIARPATGGGVSAGSVAAPPVPKRSGPAPNSVRVVAIGDSVMLGGAGRLKERFGSTAYVDAKKNRQYREAAGIVLDLREKNRLAPNLIVHLGNNGPVKSEDIKNLLAAAKGVEHILFVTVRVTKPWQDSVNAALKDADKNHKDVQIVNWYRVSEGHRDWFYSDGTHMNGTGADNYANLLHGSVPKATPTPKPKPKPTPKPTPKGIIPGDLLPPEKQSV